MFRVFRTQLLTTLVENQAVIAGKGRKMPAAGSGGHQLGRFVGGVSFCSWQSSRPG